MKLGEITEGVVTPLERRQAIQQGDFSKNIGFAIKNDLSKIIKKHIDTNWKHNTNFLDQGIQYTGDDAPAANKVIDAIIGDVYGYFIDIPRKLVTRVKKSTRTLNGSSQTVYTVTPRDSSSQIEFFKFDDKPEMGVIILNRKG